MMNEKAKQMKPKFLFYKHYKNGTYAIIDNLSKTKAERLYKAALKDLGFDLELSGCGWEQVQNPLTLEQQKKYKKAGLL